MIYHKFRFGFKKNFKVLLCRIFGHRINEDPAYHWCERCGLAYDECYHPVSFTGYKESPYKIEINGDNGETEIHEVHFDIFQLVKMTSEERDYYKTEVDKHIITVSPN